MTTFTRFLALGQAASTCGLASVPSARAQNALPRERNTVIGRPQVVARFYGPMLTGVTVSHRGRIFINFPRWGDKVPFTVAEVRNGRAVAFPNRQVNFFAPDGQRAPLSLNPSARAVQQRLSSFVSVQSVVVDPLDRLWILDTGSIKLGPVAPGGPKLIGVDLKTNRIFKTIVFPSEVALRTTYLNDIRFDLRRGAGGYAFITDSSGVGPNAIIVVDLATGRARRRLNNHPSVRPEPKFVPTVDNEPLYQQPKGQKPKFLGLGSDGIAITPTRLFYCPLASRRLYSASLQALESGSDEAVRNSVIDHGTKGASDGMESDDKGRVYAGNYEKNSIVVREPDGMYRTLVRGPEILWPDTLSVACNGCLYFTVNQLNRQADYHKGVDLRQKPYSILRVPIGAGPVLLRP